MTKYPKAFEKYHHATTLHYTDGPSIKPKHAMFRAWKAGAKEARKKRFTLAEIKYYLEGCQFSGFRNGALDYALHILADYEDGIEVVNLRKRKKRK